MVTASSSCDLNGGLSPILPPTDLPEDQHLAWVWCEYDLRKKYDPGSDFEKLMADLSQTLEVVK
jgi:hypothetical protein